MSIHPPLISSLLLGPIRSEYHILPNRRVCSGILGGTVAYAAMGYRVWSPDDLGLVSRVGASFPSDWLQRFVDYRMHIEGIHLLPEPQPWIGFHAYENWVMSSEYEPLRWYSALGIPEPPELKNFRSPTEGEEKKDNPPDIAIRPDDIPHSFYQAHGAFLAPTHLFSQLLLSVSLQTHGVGSILLAPSERILQPEATRELSTLLHGVDFFFSKEVSAFQAWPDKRHRIDTVAESIARLGPKIIMLYRGMEGVYLYDSDSGKHMHIPAYPVSPVDITGMEASFCGGFLAGWLDTFDPVESCFRGIISASLAMEGSGAWFALERMPGLAETRIRSLREVFSR